MVNFASKLKREQSRQEEEIIYPKITDKSIPSGVTCQETSGMIHDSYIRCGAPAVSIIKTKDPNAYYMCLPHACHTVDNRGGKMIFAKNPEVANTIQKEKSLKQKMAASVSGSAPSMVPAPRNTQVPEAPKEKEVIPDIMDLIGDAEDRETLEQLIAQRLLIDSQLKPLEAGKEKITDRIKTQLSSYGITQMTCLNAKISYTVTAGRKTINATKLLGAGVEQEVIDRCTDVSAPGSMLKITPAKD